MNKVELLGRLCGDPEVRYAESGTCIARYRLAVNRRVKKEGQPEADFINILALGKSGEFAEKYLHKGMRVALSGRIQTGSYTNKDGVKVYTTDVIAEEQEFCESKNESQEPRQENKQQSAVSGSAMGFDDSGFMNIPDGIEEELPFA